MQIIIFCLILNFNLHTISIIRRKTSPISRDFFSYNAIFTFIFPSNIFLFLFFYLASFVFISLSIIFLFLFLLLLFLFSIFIYFCIFFFSFLSECNICIIFFVNLNNYKIKIEENLKFKN